MLLRLEIVPFFLQRKHASCIAYPFDVGALEGRVVGIEKQLGRVPVEHAYAVDVRRVAQRRALRVERASHVTLS